MGGINVYGNFFQYQVTSLLLGHKLGNVKVD